ncbi:insulin-like peptide INSL5 [Pogona vitticeps]
MLISEVKSEGNIRLCGRDFVRAVVFTCGGSRWRRQLNDFPKGFADENNYPYLPLDVNDSTGANEKYMQKEKSQSKEFIPSISEAERDLRGQQQKFISKRQEDLMRIRITCCTIGCSSSSISALC